MSYTPQIAIPMAGRPLRWHRPNVRSLTASARPVMEAIGWILTGAGIGSLVVVAGAWALVHFTSIDDSASTSVGTDAHVTRAERGDLVLAAQPRDANAASYGM